MKRLVLFSLILAFPLTLSAKEPKKVARGYSVRSFQKQRMSMRPGSHLPVQNDQKGLQRNLHDEEMTSGTSNSGVRQDQK